MAYPSVVYGSFGDEKVTSTSKIGGLPLGTLMILPDGRKVRHTRLGNAAAVAGKVYEGAGTIWAGGNTIFSGPGAISLVPNAAPVGATTIKVTCAGTTIAANTFQDGFLYTASSVGTGRGYTYKIKANDAGAATSATGTIIVTLAESESVVVALESGTTRVRMTPSPYDGALLTVGDTTGVSSILGVACATAAASAYVWLQRSGPASVFTDATVTIVGCPVVASSSVAGAIATVVLTGTAINAVSVTHMALPLGFCMCPAGTTGQFSVVDLTLE